MEQLKLILTPPEDRPPEDRPQGRSEGRPSDNSGRPKEEPLTHANQGPRPHCAYYALAILKRMDPAEVLKTAKAALKGTRARITGTRWKLERTYDRLGYRYPSEDMDKTGRRTKTVPETDFAGRGLIRLRKRKNSHSGHLVAYQHGIVYDSARQEPMTATQYKRAAEKSRYFYMNVIPEHRLDKV